MAASQPLVKMTIVGQSLEKTTAIVSLIDFVLMEIMWNMLKSQENYLSQKNHPSQENRKAKKCLSLKIWLNQKKSCQKVEIQLILTLQKLNQSF